MGEHDQSDGGSEENRPHFETAMGESFGECVSPPVPFESASPHECCEVVWAVLGEGVTPRQLSALSADHVNALAARFGAYFNADAPTTEQVRSAIELTLSRWPVGSLGE